MKSDLVAGVEVRTVETTLAGPSGGSRVRPVALADDLLAGTRVAEFLDLPKGSHAVEVRMENRGGQTVLVRDVLVTVRGHTVVTVVMTRNCRGVSCGDGTTCQDGACVDERCTVETPEFCPSDECTTASTCEAPAAECAENTCSGGVCLRVGGSDGCATTEWCNPDLGCEPLPADLGGPRDAGTGGGPDGSTTDAGMDARIDPGLDAGVDAGGGGRSDASTTDGDVGTPDADIDAGGSADMDAGTGDGSTRTDAAVDAGGSTGMDAGSSPSPPAVLQVRTLGGGGNEQIWALDVDSSGNLYIGGRYDAPTDLGGGAFGHSGAWDGFIASYAPDGSHRWSRSFSSAFDENARSLVVDANDRVYVTGFFHETIDLGGGPLSVPGGGTDILVASFAADGTHLWSRAYGDDQPQEGLGMALAPDGDVLVTGRFFRTLDFGVGTPHTSSSSSDVYLVRFTPGGTPLWSMAFGGNQFDNGWGVGTDSTGNIYLTGTYSGAIDLGGGPLPRANQEDVFFGSFTGDGAHRWSFSFGGNGDDVAYDVRTDANDHVYLTGAVIGTADFGGGPQGGFGLDDLFVASYTSAGTYRWSRVAGSGGASDLGRDLAFASNGSLLSTGAFQNSVDPGGGSVTSVGGLDVILSSYELNADHRWTRTFGGSLGDEGMRVVVAPNGHIVLAGIFQATADFGSGPVTATGGYDIFLAWLEPG